MTLAILNQTVEIGGATYRVSNCLIDHQMGGVPVISFDVELDANPGRYIPALDAPVVVAQGSVTYRAQVHEVEAIRARNYNRFRVRCMGEARKAGLVRVLAVIEGGPAGSMIRGLWQDALPEIDVTGVTAGGPILPTTSLTYGSVAEFMDWVEQQCGWQWELNDGVLSVFDPSDLQARTPKVMTTQDWELGSVSFTAGLDIVNVARQQAWYRRTFRISPGINLGTRCYHSTPLPPGLPLAQDGWELEKVELIQGLAVDNPPIGSPPVFIPGEDHGAQGTPPDEVEIRVGSDMVEFRPALHWTPPPIVELTYRRLVWVELRDEPSIAAYGKREGPPLPQDGDIGVDASRQRLRKFLDTHALPPVRLNGISLRDDIMPGDVIQSPVDGISDSRAYIVRRVRRATQGTELELRLEAESIGLVAQLNDAPQIRTGGTSSKKEFLRRIENLERGPLNPRTISGSLALDVGPLGDITPVVTPPLRWTATTEGFTLPILETALAPWRWSASTDFTLTEPRIINAPWQWTAEVETQVTIVNFRVVEAGLIWTATAQGESVTQIVVAADWRWQAPVTTEVEITAFMLTSWPAWSATGEGSALIQRAVEVDWPLWTAASVSASSVEPEVEVVWPTWTAETLAAEPPTETVAVDWPHWTAEATWFDLGARTLETPWPVWKAETTAEIGLGLTLDQDDVIV